LKGWKLSQPWANFEGVEAFSTLGKLWRGGLCFFQLSQNFFSWETQFKRFLFWTWKIANFSSNFSFRTAGSGFFVVTFRSINYKIWWQNFFSEKKHSPLTAKN
jgi:hypothetical protein